MGRKAAMRMANGYVVRPLFRARTEDGSHWMFVVLPDDWWMITRNGKEVGIGTSERASIAAGVKEFLSLTRAMVGSKAGCNAAVGAQLDRIERGRTAAVKVAKSQGRVRPHAPKGSSAHLTTCGTAVP
jgi:hypothetical protein